MATDISELFARDPLKLTNGDIEVMIAKMRESRSQFALGNQKAGNMKPKKPSAASKKVAGLNLNLNLSSLGIGEKKE